MQFVDERGITVRELERRAREIWSPLSGTVESRWENRFGRDAVCRLRRSLEALVGQLDRALPDCLPILGYGLESRPWQNQQRSARRHPEDENLAAVEREPAGRTKRVRLTVEGLEARQQYFKLTGKVERQWAARFGAGLLHPRQAALEAIAGDGKAGTSPLFAGLEPCPRGWRAALPRPATLPHFPMVLHRGGFPDGS